METKKNPSKELAGKRFIFLQVGIICSLALAIGVLSWAKPEVQPAQLNRIAEPVYRGDNDLPPVTQPEPQKMNLAQIRTSVNSSIINITPNNSPAIVVNMPNFDPNALPGYDPGTKYGNGNGSGKGDGEPLIPDDVPVVFAEQFPTFAGRDGQSAFSEWCQENLKYPVAAIENGAEGKVFVSFIVESNGKLSSIKVERTSGSKALDNAALDVVAKAPARWAPARNSGRAVRFQYLIPVEFQLEH